MVAGAILIAAILLFAAHGLWKTWAYVKVEASSYTGRKIGGPIGRSVAAGYKPELVDYKGWMLSQLLDSLQKLLEQLRQR